MEAAAKNGDKRRVKKYSGPKDSEATSKMMAGLCPACSVPVAAA